MLFRRLVLSALLVGALAGLVLSAIQHWQVIPIIQSAERFEQSRSSPASGGPAHVHAGPAEHDHGEGWAPADGLERTAFTLLSNVLTASGFALLVLAAMTAALRYQVRSRPRARAVGPSWWHGPLWGLAGYAAFFVAPSLGMPPEIPGASAAPLEMRQLWWIFTVVFTAVGLGVLVFLTSAWRWTGAILLLIPHLVGAPHLGAGAFADFPAVAAAEMSRRAGRFVWATALANGIFWIVLGLLSGWALNRFVKKAIA